MTKNRWRSIDADFHDGAGRVLQSFFPRKAAKNSYVSDCNLLAVWLPRTHDHKSLTLCWRSFSRWGRDGIAICLAYKGGQKFLYDWLQPIGSVIISKKHFRPGGMAPSGWTRSVKAVRDIPVADYSAPRVNTTRRVAYRPPIAVSQFLLALSVSYLKQTLWRCGQLWPYVGMGSLGTRLHRDCTAMGDAAKISPRVPSTLISRSVGRRWEDMILPGHEDPRNCVDPNLGQSEWD